MGRFISIHFVVPSELDDGRAGQKEREREEKSIATEAPFAQPLCAYSINFFFSFLAQFPPISCTSCTFPPSIRVSIPKAIRPSPSQFNEMLNFFFRTPTLPSVRTCVAPSQNVTAKAFSLTFAQEYQCRSGMGRYDNYSDC